MILLLAAAICASFSSLLGANSANAPLPDGAPKDPWSLDDAWHERTETRIRWSLNGLWGVRPPLEEDRDGVVPAVQDYWGWCKIPSVWGHPVDYRCKGQEVLFAPGLKKRGMASVLKDRAWFRREFVMPTETAGKKVVLTFTRRGGYNRPRKAWAQTVHRVICHRVSDARKDFHVQRSGPCRP